MNIAGNRNLFSTIVALQDFLLHQAGAAAWEPLPIKPFNIDKHAGNGAQ